MAGKVAARKAALRERLIDIAEARIAEGGAAALKARDVAQSAECSVGAIYNIFDDLQALVLAVNGRTFRRMGAMVAQRLAEADDEDPNARLTMIGQAYLAFAADQPQLWRALFAVEMPADGPVPPWYLDELGKLFSLIADPLADLFPEASAQDLDLMTRALFSSVHGIVLLGLENRISAVPRPAIERMIAQLLSQIGTTKI